MSTLRAWLPSERALLTGVQTLLLFDADSDQKLDRAEFARFVNNFCEACGTEFHTLSEFLILLATLEDNPSEELAFLVSLDEWFLRSLLLQDPCLCPGAGLWLEGDCLSLLTTADNIAPHKPDVSKSWYTHQTEANESG